MREFIREVSRKPFLVLLASVAALGGFLFGYDTGVISGALLFITDDLHASKFDQSAIVGALLLGAMLGAIGAGYLADAISRRRTKIIGGTVFALAAIGCAVSQDVWQLITARFVLGLAVGAASFVSPLYISELAPPKIRGGLVSFNQLMITIGILVAYIVDFALKGLSNNWRWMLGLGAVPGIALAVGMILMPFSPRWLVEQGREDEARDVLERARTEGDDVEAELSEIKDVSAKEASLHDLLAKAVRPMLVVGLGLAIFQQIIGINTVIYFAPTILKFAGAGTSKSIGETIFIGVTNVVFTIVAVLLLDRVGRRVFLLAGTAGATIGLIGLGLFFQVAAIKSGASWLALASLILYIASFAVGLGPVFWLMISEIYPLNLRSPAMSVCTVTNWGFNFAVSFTFLQLVGAAGKGGTFFVYAGIGVLALLFFARFVPETKGRSLEEIESELGADETDSASPLTRERQAAAAQTSQRSQQDAETARR